MPRKYERLRYTVLVNRESGRWIMIDQFQKRLKKMQMRIAAWSGLVEEYRRDKKLRMIMITLTYKRVEDYNQGDIRKYVKALKRKYEKKIIAWAWVAEIQERGAVHYHMLLVIPKGTHFEYPDKSGMWKHGDSSVITAKTPYYLVKYTGKKYQKDLSKYPRGCRLYATSIRFGGEREKNLYRRLSGISEESNKKENGYVYVGSCVTEKYGKVILSQGNLE